MQAFWGCAKSNLSLQTFNGCMHVHIAFRSDVLNIGLDQGFLTWGKFTAKG